MLNPQKSVWVVVPMKPVKKGGGKDPAVSRETEALYQLNVEAQNSKEGVCRRIGWKPKAKGRTAELMRMNSPRHRHISQLTEPPLARPA